MSDPVEIVPESGREKDYATPELAYEVTAVETIHQKYDVRAANPEQARARLRRYFADPEIVAPGIVKPAGEGLRVRWQIRDEKRAKKG